MDDLIAALKRAVGRAGYLEGADISPAYHLDIGGEREGLPRLVLRPANTAETSAVLALCSEARHPVVPQGGMTGLVSAGTPVPGEIVLSLQRMNAIEALDESAATMTVQAGVPLQAVQEAAEARGLFYPLDIGSRGSCTIGGNLATNAGGNRVIRYGMARDLVLGLEAVLACGTVVGGMNSMRKNNAGFDLKHLFIGSEGTLGVITRAVLRLYPRPRSQCVAFCALPGFASAIALLRMLEDSLGGRLSAFEALWRNSYRLILDSVPAVRAPLPDAAPFYVLVEAMGADEQADQARFEAALGAALDRALVSEVVLARSVREVRELWAVRDAISEAALKLKPYLGYDVSMPIDRMETFADRVTREAGRNWPLARIGLFGHIGDGNVHVVTDVGEDGLTPRSRMDELVYGATREVNGSVSAEHGIGLEKKPYLSVSRSENEIALMRSLKGALDPKGLLNPGKIF